MPKNNFIDIKFSGFIDRKGVSEKFRRALFKPVIKAAALTRTIAKRSIRLGKKSAPRGQPPRSHTGLLKKFIFFAADREREEVLIGPMRLNTRGNKGQRPIPTELLEYGGTARVGGENAQYDPHPYMRPARDKALEQFPGLFKG